MSTQRAMPGGWVDRASLPKGANGRNLCRWCSLEVPQDRRTFCSEWCVHEWKLRTDPGYLRAQVFARDRGVCAICGLDCEAERRKRKRKRTGRRTSLWDADHIVPVVEGGGECDLDNMRTLCLRCHREVTAELRRRRGRAPDA